MMIRKKKGRSKAQNKHFNNHGVKKVNDAKEIHR